MKYGWLYACIVALGMSVAAPATAETLKLTTPGGTGEKCIDAPNGNINQGTPLVIWSCHGGWNQQFALNANSIVIRASSQPCLDVFAGGTMNFQGKPVGLWACHGGVNQQFIPRPLDYAGQRYQFRLGETGLCLAAADPALRDGSHLTVARCATNDRLQVFVVGR